MFMFFWPCLCVIFIFLILFGGGVLFKAPAYIRELARLHFVGSKSKVKVVLDPVCFCLICAVCAAVITSDLFCTEHSEYCPWLCYPCQQFEIILLIILLSKEKYPKQNYPEM